MFTLAYTYLGYVVLSLVPSSINIFYSLISRIMILIYKKRCINMLLLVAFSEKELRRQYRVPINYCSND